jgi:hypothetical protein
MLADLISSGPDQQDTRDDYWNNRLVYYCYID